MSPLMPSADDTGLVVVDFQTALLSAMKEKIADKITKNGVILIKGAKILGLPIVVTEQYPRGLGETIPPIIEALGDSYRPFEKLSFSIMGEEEIRKAVIGLKVKNIVLCGMETHVCVLQSGLDLVDFGIVPYVAADAVSSRKKLDWEIAMDLARRGGGEVTSTETVLFKLLKAAGGSEFKEISKLLK
ncbi:MAG: isochorismatase family protein [Deltaproteobacteria bacterium]|uniref:Isochorismatase family protein n=1 Tax=Candidatus Zymogenus saltonus TaxID=2844893 RepID=A0A9D8KH28_9DELT|nr:isochorismatase family protein [Candidatus Zymogenus saltonus]